MSLLKAQNFSGKTMFFILWFMRYGFRITQQTSELTNFNFFSYRSKNLKQNKLSSFPNYKWMTTWETLTWNFIAVESELWKYNWLCISTTPPLNINSYEKRFKLKQMLEDKQQCCNIGIKIKVQGITFIAHVTQRNSLLY